MPLLLNGDSYSCGKPQRQSLPGVAALTSVRGFTTRFTLEQPISDTLYSPKLPNPNSNPHRHAF